MRAIEDRYIAQCDREVAATREMHRLAYVYYLERLVDVAMLPEHERRALTEEVRECAQLCRRERALHLAMSEARADRLHGSVLELAAASARARRSEAMSDGRGATR